MPHVPPIPSPPHVIDTFTPPSGLKLVLPRQRSINAPSTAKVGLLVTFNGADVAQDSGCWTTLRGKAYQLGAEFVCASNIKGPSDTCAQWLSLDSTNGARHQRSSLSLLLWLLVVFLAKLPGFLVI